MAQTELPPPVTRLLPREHGTWAMLLVPWVVGCGVAGRVTVEALLLLVAAVSLYLGHGQLLSWYRQHLMARPDPRALAGARRALIGFTVMGLVAAAPLAARAGFARLSLLAALAAVLTAVSLRLVARRVAHALPGQLLAALGLSLAAPAAYEVVAHGPARTALALWLLDAAFFVWAVFYVRLQIEARARRAPLASFDAKLSFARAALGLDVVVLLAAFAAVRLGPFSTLTLGAFLPAAIQAIAGVARLDRPAALKTVGLLLTAHSILFALLVVWLA